MLSAFSTPGQSYAIRCEASNTGIPYADYFYVLSDYCLVRTANPNETRVVVYNAIKYNKSPWSMIKGGRGRRGSRAKVYFFI